MPQAKSPAPQPVEMPRAVVLLASFGDHSEGAVLAVDADRLSQLDVEGVKYRPASDTETRLANIG